MGAAAGFAIGVGRLQASDAYSQSDLYDQQTNHGRIVAEQLRWERIIKAEKASGAGSLNALN